MSRTVATAVLLVATLLGCGQSALAAGAGTPTVVRAGKADGPYHALMQELVGTIAGSATSDLAIALEESQSSVQNVIDAAQRDDDAAFTAPPRAIAQAVRGEKPFPPDPRYRAIRSLFPLPFEAVHWIVRADSGVSGWASLAGQPFIAGARGSLAERQTASVLTALALGDLVPLIEIDPARASAALAEGQVAGFALAGPFPLPGLAGLAAATPIRLLGLSAEDLARVPADEDGLIPITIPKGTYPGVVEDVTTLALPAGVYATTGMTESAAYALTKAFWESKAALDRDKPHWQAARPAALVALGAPLHRGALRWYEEAGLEMRVPLR